MYSSAVSACPSNWVSWKLPCLHPLCAGMRGTMPNLQFLHYIFIAYVYEAQCDTLIYLYNIQPSRHCTGHFHFLKHFFVLETSGLFLHFVNPIMNCCKQTIIVLLCDKTQVLTMHYYPASLHTFVLSLP